jgi:hypothetical protein
VEYQYYRSDLEVFKPSKNFIQSKLSLRLYNQLRVIKRFRNLRARNSGRKEGTEQLLLIKKYASTHSYAVGKKPGSTIFPVIIINKKYLFWPGVIVRRDFKQLTRELID